jgi:eukaryotic-like serine/threonine-protein kinase
MTTAMSLTPGTRLGPYQVLEPLGAGGMGVVYRGRDTRLDRTVAVKVLAAPLAADPQFRERFDREARSLSAINHPHICALYDIGRQDTVDFLVMELVEGESLAARLERGPLATDEALRIGSQVADALDHAHRAGIVHRDLKPGNVMLSPGGTKLLDFGLARQTAPSTLGRMATTELRGATQPGSLTGQGTILGTFHYMAPEQVEGRDADARSDIWAFGCLLYEMLSGRRAFDGASPASLIAAILERQPAPIDVAGTPLAFGLQRLIAACLEKRPDERFQSMRDVRRAIEWFPQHALSQAEPHPAARLRRRVWLAVPLAVILTAGMAAAMIWRLPAASAHPAVLFNVTLPQHQGRMGGPSPAGGVAYPSPAVSPDGRRIAFVARGPAGDAIFLRPVDSTHVELVRGTTGARHPFWSPEGASLAFFAGGKLKTIELASGISHVIADAPTGFGGSWGSDGTILFSPDEHAAIFRVAAAGGTPAPVTALDPGRQEKAHRWPQWLPGGRHFIYMPWNEGTTLREIQLGSLGGASPRPLFRSQSAAVAAADHFLYVTDMPPRLTAQAYDPRTLQLKGQPFAAVSDDNVDYDWRTGFPSASVAGDTLVYTSGKHHPSQLTWVDRDGRTLETLGEPAVHFDPRLSPNGARLALERHDPGAAAGDVWTIDLARRAYSRLTSAPGFETSPVWSPDGRQVAYASDQGAPGIWVRDATGSASETQLFVPPARSFPTDWSPDGRHILLMLSGGRTGMDIWRYDVEREEASPVLATPFNEGWATFSPDGRWIAYVSDEDQEQQVYVRSWLDGAVKTRISTGGGRSPQWRGDGREIFYLAPDDTMMAAPVQASGSQLAASAPVALFTAGVRQNRSIRNQYAVSVDGQRFLVLSGRDADASPLVGVVNWRTLLRR